MQFWFDAVEYAYATGDTGDIKANSATDCETCNRFINKIDDQYAVGGSFRGVRVQITNVASAPLEDFGAPISLQVEEPPSQRIDSDGSVQSITTYLPPSNTTFFAAWTDGRWVAGEVAKDEQ